VLVIITVLGLVSYKAAEFLEQRMLRT
jgi:hypothetical protein